MSALLAALAPCLSGCSLKLMALRQTTALIEGGLGAFYDEPDPVLAQEAMGAQLKLVEAFLRSDPSDGRLNLIASQGFGAYAFLFLEGRQDDRAREFYRRGKDFGFKALASRAAFRNAAAMDLAALEKALATAGKGDAPGLFWTAYCLGGWVNLSKDNMEALADLPKAAALMERAGALDPGYQLGGADLFLGVYYASRPRILGGDPDKSRKRFDRARELTGGKYLMGLLLEARSYAVAVQDQDLFVRLLAKVQSQPAGALPESRLADEVAKRMAAGLMEKKDDLF